MRGEARILAETVQRRAAGKASAAASSRAVRLAGVGRAIEQRERRLLERAMQGWWQRRRRRALQEEEAERFEALMGTYAERCHLFATRVCGVLSRAWADALMPRWAMTCFLEWRRASSGIHSRSARYVAFRWIFGNQVPYPHTPAVTWSTRFCLHYAMGTDLPELYKDTASRRPLHRNRPAARSLCWWLLRWRCLSVCGLVWCWFVVAAIGGSAGVSVGCSGGVCARGVCSVGRSPDNAAAE